MTKVISFDVDGTLVDYQYADLVWCEGVPKLYAHKNKISFEQAKKFVMSEYMKVGERRIEWYNIRYWFKYFGLEGWEDLLRDYEDRVRVYTDVENCLRRLSRKYKLVIASNAAREFIEVTTKNIRKYFSAIFSSTSDFKLVKKTPDFYLNLLERLGIERADLLHVGDHFEFDYLVPKKLGIKALYLDRNGSRSGEDVIRSLKELVVRLSLE
jgi:putative hydrolase of the HAD superfamily